MEIKEIKDMVMPILEKNKIKVVNIRFKVENGLNYLKICHACKDMKKIKEVADTISAKLDELGVLETYIFEMCLEKEWPLYRYYEKFEAYSLKTGDAIMVVTKTEDGVENANGIVTKLIGDGLFINNPLSEGDEFYSFSDYGKTYKLTAPSAGELDFPAREFLFAEAIYRFDEEYPNAEPSDNQEVIKEIYLDMFNSEFLVNSDVSTQITRERINDFLRRGGVIYE